MLARRHDDSYSIQDLRRHPLDSSFKIEDLAIAWIGNDISPSRTREGGTSRGARLAYLAVLGVIR